MALLLVVAGSALAADPAPKKPIVAVLYFDTPEKGPHADELFDLRKGVAEMIIADLVASDRVIVVERARLEAVLAELKLQASDKFDASTAVKVGRLLGANYLVFGTMVLVPAVKERPLAFTTTVTIEERGFRRQKRGRAELEGFFEMQEQMSSDVLAMIAEAQALTPPEPSKKAERERPTFKTALKYSRALDAKDKKDTAKAKQLLTEVVKEQPDFKLAQADLLNLSN
jgi:TolB-like protein